MMDLHNEVHEDSELVKPLKLKVVHGATPPPYSMGVGIWIEGEDEVSENFCRMISEIQGIDSSSGAYGKAGFTVLGSRPFDQEEMDQMEEAIAKKTEELEALVTRFTVPGMREQIEIMHRNVTTSEMILSAERARMADLMEGREQGDSYKYFLLEVRRKLDSVYEGVAPDVPVPEGD